MELSTRIDNRSCRDYFPEPCGRFTLAKSAQLVEGNLKGSTIPVMHNMMLWRLWGTRIEIPREKKLQICEYSVSICRVGEVGSKPARLILMDEVHATSRSHDRIQGCKQRSTNLSITQESSL